jgi:tetratricopeptide (TPR) repeat protein
MVDTSGKMANLYLKICFRQIIVFLGLLGLLTVSGLQTLASSPSEPHYLDDALIDGKLVQRWNDSAKVIYITIKPGSSVPGWKPKMAGYVKDAFSEWERALNGQIRFEYTIDPGLTDIVVDWNQKSKGMQVGHQNIRWHNNTITNADIIIAMQNPQGRLLSDAEIKYIALHEIGHALGIRGHSKNPDDIMYTSIQPQNTRLTDRDIATIRALYTRKPDITNPVGIHLLQFRLFEYYVRLGIDANRQKRYETAYEYFLKAREYYPIDNQLPYYIGISQYNLRKFDQAIPNLRKAARVPGNNQVSAQYFLANALLVQGASEINAGNKASGSSKLNEAKMVYNTLLKNNKIPNNIRSLVNEDMSTLNDVASKVSVR